MLKTKKELPLIDSQPEVTGAWNSSEWVNSHDRVRVWKEKYDISCLVILPKLLGESTFRSFGQEGSKRSVMVMARWELENWNIPGYQWMYLSEFQALLEGKDIEAESPKCFKKLEKVEEILSEISRLIDSIKNEQV